MAEVLVEFTDIVSVGHSGPYRAQACGGEAPDGKWQGWIEFLPLTGGPPLRTGRETTQPNRQDTLYWATGLTAVYLEGALERALLPRPVVTPAPATSPVFDGPAPATTGPPPTGNGILNPFSVLQKGEVVLRRQLAALSSWHLVNILRDYDLSSQTDEELAHLTHPQLVELIVTGAKMTPQPAPAD